VTKFSGPKNNSSLARSYCHANMQTPFAYNKSDVHPSVATDLKTKNDSVMIGDSITGQTLSPCVRLEVTI